MSNTHTTVLSPTEQHPRNHPFRAVPKTRRTPPDLHKHPTPPLFCAQLFRTPKHHHVSAGQRLFRLFPYYVGRGGYPPATPSLRHVGPPAQAVR